MRHSEIKDPVLKQILKEVAEKNNIPYSFCVEVFRSMCYVIRKGITDSVYSVIKIPYFGCFYSPDKALDRYVAKQAELSSERNSEDSPIKS